MGIHTTVQVQLPIHISTIDIMQTTSQIQVFSRFLLLIPVCVLGFADYPFSYWTRHKSYLYDYNYPVRVSFEA